jgi:hypothetical protein
VVIGAVGGVESHENGGGLVEVAGPAQAAACQRGSRKRSAAET